MNFFASINWIWPAILLAFLCGFLLSNFLKKRKLHKQNSQANQEYFKGINFLINQETDKAIEVFIKALEVDSETVELHLALGGLFRRNGQVDRATRIHQNLIARPNLTEAQRLQSIYELAQDYSKAGLLDRAENLFLELKEFYGYRQTAVEGLCLIYQQEKEWQKAIDVVKSVRQKNKAKHSKSISHYYCELSILADENNDLALALSYAQQAVSYNEQNDRAHLLVANAFYNQNKHKKALKSWMYVADRSPHLIESYVEKIVDSFRQIGDRKGLNQFLSQAVETPRTELGFKFWRTALVEELGVKRAFEMVLNQIKKGNLTSVLANYFYNFSVKNKLSNEQSEAMLINFLQRAKENTNEYQCAACGYSTRSHHWFCPNCMQWETFK